MKKNWLRFLENKKKGIKKNKFYLNKSMVINDKKEKSIDNLQKKSRG